MNPKKVESPQERKVKQSRDKAAKFIELATKRVNKALRAIEGIAALSNRNSYTYDDAQVAKIFTALHNAINEADASFKAKGSSSKFSL